MVPKPAQPEIGNNSNSNGAHPGESVKLSDIQGIGNWTSGSWRRGDLNDLLRVFPFSGGKKVIFGLKGEFFILSLHIIGTEFISIINLPANILTFSGAVFHLDFKRELPWRNSKSGEQSGVITLFPFALPEIVPKHAGQHGQFWGVGMQLQIISVWRIYPRSIFFVHGVINGDILIGEGINPFGAHFSAEGPSKKGVGVEAFIIQKGITAEEHFLFGLLGDGAQHKSEVSADSTVFKPGKCAELPGESSFISFVKRADNIKSGVGCAAPFLSFDMNFGFSEGTSESFFSGGLDAEFDEIGTEFPAF